MGHLLKNFYVLIFPGVTLIQMQNIVQKHFIFRTPQIYRILNTIS